MNIREIEQELSKKGAYARGTMDEIRKEAAENRQPHAYVSNGIFVRPINEDVRIRINYADIVWVEADNHNCHIHLSIGSYVSVGYNIMLLEKMLPGRWFVKINRSEIVNINRVYKYCGNLLYMDRCSRPFTVSKSNRRYVFSCFKEIGK